MANQKRRRGKLIYTLFLLLWLLLLTAAAVYGLGRVWEYAKEYELSRPSHTMDQYVNSLPDNLWEGGIAVTVRVMPHEVQSDDEVTDHVRRMLSDGVSYVRKGGGDERHAVYSLRCNGREFGVVTLVEDEDYTGEIDTSKFPWKLLKWSIRPWKVESESFDFNGLYYPVEVVIPRTYSAWLNDVKLDSRYIVEETIHYDVLDDYYDLFESLPTKVRYRFDDAIGLIEPVIRDEQGEVFHIDPSKDDSQFIKACTEERLARLSEFTAGFVVNYLKYTSGVIDLDNRMKNAMDGLSWAHTASITVDSSQLNGALDLGDNYYMLDITANSTTFAIGKGEVKNVSNMRVIVRDRNDDIRAICLELY